MSGSNMTAQDKAVLCIDSYMSLIPVIGLLSFFIQVASGSSE